MNDPAIQRCIMESRLPNFSEDFKLERPDLAEKTMNDWMLEEVLIRLNR